MPIIYSYHMQVRFCFSAVCDKFFLFVTQISQEWLNGFVPYSQGRRVCSLARTSLNVKVKGTKTGKLLRHPH